MVMTADRTAQLERLMDQYGDKVLRLAFFYVKDRQTAEDIAQDVFLKVFTHLKGFRGDASVYTWIYRITVNKCRDYLRSWPQRHLTLTDQLEARAEPRAETEEQALSRCRERELLREVLSLAPHYREVVVLRYWGELSNREIAAVLGEREGTVRSRLHRARNILRAILEEEVDGHGGVGSGPPPGGTKTIRD